MSVRLILKMLRKEKGISQKAVAKLLNISETGYASWEQGLSEPSIDSIKKLCQIFNVSADYLLGLENEYGVKVENSFNNSINSGTILIGNNNKTKE